MSEENIFYNPEARAISEKITMEMDPMATEIFSEEKRLAILSAVEVKTSDDRIFKESIEYSKGTPNTPLA